MNNLVHLHVHTVNSLLDGFNKIDNLLNRVKELNMSSIAITDHGTLAGTYSFQNKCKEAGIKPILGIEMYHTKDMNMIIKPIEERRKIAEEKALNDNINIPDKIKTKEKNELLAPYMYDTKGYHLVLLAKNQTGWNNLIKISSIANEKGLFNGRGHCDNKLLKEYSEGIICTTACMNSMISHNIRNDKYEEAFLELVQLYNIFGENLYLELQPLNLFDQLKINLKLIKFANEYDIKLIATNDSHYTYKDDWYVHDVLMCIGLGKKYNDENRMKYSHEFWIRSYDEMIQAFTIQFQEQMVDEFDMNLETYLNYIEQALYNTNLIGESISEDIKLGSDKELLPEVDIPKGYTPATWLSHQCWVNLYKYLKDNNLYNKREIYEARLKHELNVINVKGFASYFLIVQDFIDWGMNNDCPFGPGRGSAAGSLVAFLLGIVKGTDPVEYDLLFFRFLTIDRKAMPDIDSDISMLDRQKMITYIENKYGHDNICQVGTVTKLGVLNGLKDVMRVFDVPFSIQNNITKKLSTIIDTPSLTFKMFDSLKDTDELKYNEFLNLENEYKEYFNIARQLEGIPRNYGIHAGGIAVTPMPINDMFPTRIANGKKVTVWDKDEAEKAGIVKIDLLGLKTISVINETLKLIKKNHGITITLDELYNNKSIRNDENVFYTLSKKKSECVFQMESDLFKGLLDKIQPDNINDLIAITSIARPGPLSAGFDKTYANRKNGIEDIEYDLNCKEILNNTYGCMLYQEQLMLMAKEVAGFNDSQSDTYLRKSVA